MTLRLFLSLPRWLLIPLRLFIRIDLSSQAESLYLYARLPGRRYHFHGGDASLRQTRQRDRRWLRSIGIDPA